ncbi:MAG: enoyl-CoA hydratase/isomerase family protein [Rhodocyclaceae bacterium]|nr:enoyl-CoA hydratase/isomerase family protein [Rhodocyclaceae bacterium]MCA3025277.1 enoyl-CoA hydratase/isomerase family protein [Rhodocyclaceae bacterium]MCA3031244.1 enoyl-CoA hydratase/isomerase family protein [Rhodocyclaceae bacterium]MCA3038765.1 enoyl-CoA hydratase/isomerase family protein [Rhodocyclaceae bacterium]MCA3041086.1 enoyl-CoA hydratase/isomerase family protein [Rhodocyclaceae bacterium]
MSNFHIRKVAVLGAGVMGAQIAAHLTNANVQTVLFDLPAKEGPKNGVVTKAIDGMMKLSPDPFAVKSKAAQIAQANYDEHLELLRGCDLVIEAISERMDWKKALYEKVAPFISEKTIFASNTSGLSITELSKVFPEALRHRFCGIHFFNPPRYMKLVELIPTALTEPSILDQLETFLTSTVGKGVVRAKDTPNFVANRIGVFSIAATMHHTTQFGLPFDVVDALTGPAIGRAKSATYRTSDVVGLDTMSLTIKTLADTLPNDPWHKYYQSPAWLQALLAKGALGQKTKAGIYTKKGKDILVLDLAAQDYRPSTGKMDDEVAAMLKIKNPAEQIAALRASTNPQAQFLWSIFRDLWHYCAVQLADIAHSARDIDFAIRWGFGYKMGPFETWQAAGWQQIAAWIAEDIAAGKAMANIPLPAWVAEAGRLGVHSQEGSYSASSKSTVARSSLPVYQRQIFPELLLGEYVGKSADKGTTVLDSEGVRVWTTKGFEDVAILSFKSKMHSLGEEVLDGVLQALELAEQSFKAAVIWHEAPYAVGANLVKALEALQAEKYDEFETMVAKFQHTSMRIKHSMVPVVSAVDGMALGGGCEFVMHSNKVVASIESYIGLVEAGVGLLPAGAGCKELAMRAALAAQGGDVMPQLQKIFTRIAMGEVSKSGEHAKEMGYLRESDRIVFNKDELLYVALTEARAMAEGGWRPALPAAPFAVAGYTGVATLKMMLINMKQGGFISEHDYEVSSRIAEVLCGGMIEPGSLVDEKWMLDLERKHFVALAKMPKTQERIAFMLKNGKPLRN